MAKKDQEEEVFEAWEPTKQDIEELRKNLLKYQQQTIKGRLQSPFHQYCYGQGYIFFDEHGEVVVSKPLDYTAKNRINAKREAAAFYDRERYLKAHPEEQEKMNEHWNVIKTAMHQKFGIPQ